MSSIKFDYRTQSNKIDAISSILLGRKTKRHTKIDKLSVSIQLVEKDFTLITAFRASVKDINT